MPELINTDLLLQELIDTLVNTYNQPHQTAAQHAHDLIEDVIDSMNVAIDTRVETYMGELHDN